MASQAFRWLLPAVLLVVLGATGCNDPESQCLNGQDDDGDGLIDCADPDCAEYCQDAGADGGDADADSDTDGDVDGGQDAAADAAGDDSG
jgi:hypothetical protein